MISTHDTHTNRVRGFPINSIVPTDILCNLFTYLPIHLTCTTILRFALKIIVQDYLEDDFASEPQITHATNNKKTNI